MTQVFCNLEMETNHDTISRFLQKPTLVIKHVFRCVVKYTKRLGVISGKEVIIDGTDVPTLFKSDPTAKWVRVGKKEYVWGETVH